MMLPSTQGSGSEIVLSALGVLADHRHITRSALRCLGSGWELSRHDALDQDISPFPGYPDGYFTHWHVSAIALLEDMEVRRLHVQTFTPPRRRIPAWRGHLAGSDPEVPDPEVPTRGPPRANMQPMPPSTWVLLRTEVETSP